MFLPTGGSEIREFSGVKEMPKRQTNQVAFSVPRRSQRVLLDLPVVIRGEAGDKRAFQEETFTLTLSAHGARVFLANRVTLGQRVVLMNSKTLDEREGRIAYLGRFYAGLAQVGIEFARPAPEFWLNSCLPADWSPPADWAAC